MRVLCDVYIMLCAFYVAIYAPNTFQRLPSAAGADTRTANELSRSECVHNCMCLCQSDAQPYGALRLHCIVCLPSLFFLNFKS